MKALSVATLSYRVFSTNSYITGIIQVKTIRQALPKSIQPFCPKKGRSVLIVSLYLSL